MNGMATVVYEDVKYYTSMCMYVSSIYVCMYVYIKTAIVMNEHYIRTYVVGDKNICGYQ